MTLHQVLFYFCCAAVALLPLFYNVGKWFMKEDEAWAETCESLIKIAQVLKEWGLELIPDLLIKIATRNWAGAWADVEKIIHLFEMSPDHIVKVFDKVFARVLTHKLTDPASLALLAAQVTDAQKKLGTPSTPVGTAVRNTTTGMAAA